MGVPFREYRCPTCHKLFFKGLLIEGEIEVKCRGCHEVANVAADKHDELVCLIERCPYRVPLRAKA